MLLGQHANKQEIKTNWKGMRKDNVVQWSIAIEGIALKKSSLNISDFSHYSRLATYIIFKIKNSKFAKKIGKFWQQSFFYVSLTY